MCLGIPGKLMSIEEGVLRTGRVAFGGIIKEICLEYVPEAMVGDYVLVHVGFALSCIDEAEANRVLDYLRQLGDVDALGPTPPAVSAAVPAAVPAEKAEGTDS